jgi:hypothetical protein
MAGVRDQTISKTAYRADSLTGLTDLLLLKQD